MPPLPPCAFMARSGTPLPLVVSLTLQLLNSHGNHMIPFWVAHKAGPDVVTKMNIPYGCGNQTPAVQLMAQRLVVADKSKTTKLKLYTFRYISPVKTCDCLCKIFVSDKIGNVYSLEHTDIPKVSFTTHHVGHCCPYAIRWHCCALGHSCTNAIRGHCCTTMCSNHGYKGFPFLRNNDPRSSSCLPRWKKIWQTNRHILTHKANFVHTRKRWTPNNGPRITRFSWIFRRESAETMLKLRRWIEIKRATGYYICNIAGARVSWMNCLVVFSVRQGELRVTSSKSASRPF
jgi:hypothetical protein